jgi:hypothetical protein
MDRPPCMEGIPIHALPHDRRRWTGLMTSPKLYQPESSGNLSERSFVRRPWSVVPVGSLSPPRAFYARLAHVGPSGGGRLRLEAWSLTLSASWCSANRLQKPLETRPFRPILTAFRPLFGAP